MIYEVKDIFAKTYPEPGKLYVYAQENSRKWIRIKGVR